MTDLKAIKDDLVFGLDIGTRSIVGVVGYLSHQVFHVVAMAEEKHATRAMLDGQIHDIYKVGDTIRRVKNSLERQIGFALTDVCIAAAGRVLKTVNASAEYAFENETRVTQEHIYSLNLLAVEKAHAQVNENSTDIHYYCVGNTPVNYKLNSFDISNLEGHKAEKIGVELIATFLPEEVVDGLYQAVEYAGLHVASLTLEPIAAMNVAIPEQYRLLNIGLIDVGAGTSDICLTKDGSIIAYGMIPLAGDEITEVIAKTYLVDFNTAEQIKVEASDKKEGIVEFRDIMGLTQKIPAEQILKDSESVIDKMADAAAQKIIELNGNRPVNAVFVVGGGGKMASYTQKVAEHLGIMAERVAVRGEEVLGSISFDIDGFKKDSLYVTPIGICTNYYTQKNSFMFVTVNGERIKMYDNNRLTVVDAVMQVGFPNEKLFPQRGGQLEFTVNGKTRLIRGEAGDGAVIMINGKNANLNTKIEQNDIIEVKESTAGAKASTTIGQLDEFKATVSFIVDDKKVNCPRFAYVNGELKSEFYEINNGDDISMADFYTVEQLFTFLDMDMSNLNIYVNNEPAQNDTKVYENFSVKTHGLSDYTVSSGYDDETYSEAEDIQENAEYAENTEYTEYAKSHEDKAAKAGANTEGNTVQEEVKQSDDVVKDIFVLINHQPVKLSGKKKYVLVDIFDFYDFDLSKPQGSDVVLKLNGQKADYLAPLKDGDLIDLYWEG